MTRLALIPTAIALSAAVGLGLCHAAGWMVNPRALCSGAAVTLIAGIAAGLPAVMLRRASQATVVQAALAGTVIHMLVVLLLGGIAFALKLPEAPTPLLAWTSAFYGTTLVALLAVLVPVIRAATPMREKSASRPN